MSDLVLLDATALGAQIRNGGLSCREVMSAYLAQIERLNPQVNAIVDLREADQLLAEADVCDQELARGICRGPLHGIPQAIKDLEPVKGVRMTMGSPLLKDFVPPADGIMAERIRAAGAVFIGRTNTPEFGLGSHTYNPVHGHTRNAYDQTKSAGGSSGGAAVALALRMLPVADGGDYMGSLRNPAGWNSVYSLRPSIGRIPSTSRDLWLPSMGVLGPMARSVRDLALLYSVQTGDDQRAPLSLDGSGNIGESALERDVHGLRLGWLGDLGGALPYEPGVVEVCEGALRAFEDLGCTVEPAQPDFSIDVLWRSYLTLRAWQAGSGLLELYRDPKRRAMIKPEALFEIESGAKLSAYDVSAASSQRSHWYNAVLKLFERYDFLALPSAQCFAFDVNFDWPKEINGRAMTTYHEWMKVVVPATMAGAPVVTVPAGFNAQGLAMGLQIIGRNHAELACLQIARAYEQATDWVERRKPALL